MIQELTQATGINETHVRNILSLLADGATVPFIARYRKEQTGGATDGQLRAFQERYEYARKLEARKDEVRRLIEERGRLTSELEAAIAAADRLAVVEDLYRPFKEKRNTRAGLAIKRGLEPLADALLAARSSVSAIRRAAGDFIGPDVPDVEAAISGAKDIVAERYSDTPAERQLLRDLAWKNGSLAIKKGKEFDSSGVYARLAERSERISSIPSHRYLALMRGVREKQLSVKLSVNMDAILKGIGQTWVPRDAGSSASILLEALEDGLKRLLLPSIEREIHTELKRRSDEQAVATFGRNLEQLLMTPPVTGMAVLGVDPAYRTGCKLAAVDQHGTYLEHAVIYPTPPQSDYSASRDTVMALIRRHRITGVAIGNGTGSRETQEFFAQLNAAEQADIRFTVVSEAGASVYSASEIGQEEYPDLDVTIRGALSIAHRLQNPMAALVKIDPKSLGIGQYQHDVDQTLLNRRLAQTTEDLVNRVGVDVNSASVSLLTHVAGLGPALAKRIVTYRQTEGPFRSKTDLRNVRGLGEAAFTQCSGFMRIRDGASMLDTTGVHPESYAVATAIAESFDVQSLTRSDLPRVLGHLSDAKLTAGEQTVWDIITELQKPGFDPRSELPVIPFRDELKDITMLHPGSMVSGVVRNIVDFGAFVDVGLKNDGLIHISQIAERRISHPLEVLSVNQFLPAIRVLAVDVERGKLDLSLREDGAGAPSRNK